MKTSTYLLFNGQCEEAFNVYARVLGGTIEALMRHREMPGEGPGHAGWEDKVMHVSLRLGGDVLMGSDAPPGYFQQPQGFSVSLQYADPAEGEKVFNALAEGGLIKMPFQETFWAAGYGMLVDRFGIPWMVNCGQKG